jgi:carnitine 3-dehydrogenase
MNSPIKKIAIIGTGVIGAGWTIRLLAKNKVVNVYDPNISQLNFLKNEIRRVSKSVLRFYKTNKLNINNLYFNNSIKDAVKDADLIQENAPENLNIKKKIVKEISKWAKPNAIIASSSSGLLPTKIQQSCKLPERFLIAHPFNPVYLLPLVELVKGKKTKINFIKKSKIFYQSIDMYPLILKKEVEGYLSDRLQESMWRESLHILNEDLASSDDLDKAIIHGPGLRWALMGNFLTFHLAGGKLGMKHTLEQFGPTLKIPWTKLKAPNLTKKLSNKIIRETKKQSKGTSIKELTTMRDNFIVDLLKLKNKYKF